MLLLVGIMVMLKLIPMICFSGIVVIWGVPEMGIPWMVFLWENQIKMDDLGVPPFQETSICFLLPIEISRIFAVDDFETCTTASGIFKCHRAMVDCRRVDRKRYL